MDFALFISKVCDFICGSPLLLYVSAISLTYTIVLRGMQFTYLLTAFKTALFPSAKEDAQASDVSPFSAFINTINANLGNGVIAGVATAIYSGGPGAAFWFVIFGFILMGVRFGEVYLSALCAAKTIEKTTLGGPMLYLKEIAGGAYLPYIYAFFCVIYGLIGANIIQSNSIAVSLNTTWAINPIISAIALVLFVLYILFGGAERIVKISMSLVPVKVIVFIVSSFTILLFHYQLLWSALCLIVKSGVGYQPLIGGAIGFSFQQMIAAGMSRSIFATESGLGSAAIMFGSSGSSNPIQSGFMGMISTFISTCIGFIVALCIVVSGVWNTGLNSTALTIASFSTVFGVYGGWIVSFLAVSFGLGVMVSYAYVVRSAWLFLTNNKYDFVFTIAYTVCAFVGCMAAVDLVWDIAGIILAIMLFVNMYGLLLLLPQVKRTLATSLPHYKA